jgi:MFS family permease
LAHLFLLGIVYVSFISLGLPDGILGVAWPAIRADMGQPLAAVGIITITMTACSATSSFFAGWFAKHMGTGVVVAASCLMTALALVGYSFAPSFAWLIALAVPLGLGAGAVDASLNHFVAAHYSSRRMNWLHGFWGIGATSGPIIMGLALASPAGWTSGARTIGYLQLALAALLLGTLSLWRREHSKPPHGGPSGFKPTTPLSTWLAPALFLLYVSAEMGTGLWAASILVSSRGRRVCAADPTHGTVDWRLDADGCGLRTRVPIAHARNSAALPRRNCPQGNWPANDVLVRGWLLGAGRVWPAGHLGRAGCGDAGRGGVAARTTNALLGAGPHDLKRKL